MRPVFSPLADLPLSVASAGFVAVLVGFTSSVAIDVAGGADRRHAGQVWRLSVRSR